METMFKRAVLAISCLALAVSASTHPGPAEDWELRIRSAYERGDLDGAERLAGSALADAAGRGLAREWLGRIALARRQPALADGHFQAARVEGRASLELDLAHATALAQLKRHSEAAALLEAAAARHPDRPGIRYELAACYFDLGKPRQAWPHLEEAYRLGLRHSGVVLKLVEARLVSGREDLALDLGASAASQSPDFAFLLELGKLLFHHLQYRRALAPLMRAWRQMPGSYDAGMYLALSHYLLKQYRECAAVLEQVEAGPSPPLDFRVLLGGVHARRGAWQDAQRELEKAISDAPDRAEGYLNLGLLSLERGERRRAGELLEAGARRIRPGTKLLYSIEEGGACAGLALPEPGVGDPERGRFYSDFGRVLLEAGHRGSALAVFRLALESDARAGDAYSGIGRICRELDRAEVARMFLERGIEIDPGLGQLHFELGLVSQSQGLLEEAARSYHKSIELAGRTPPASYLVQLGTVETTRQREREAEAAFLRALELERRCAPAYYELGKLYLKRREYGRAEQALEQAVSLDPLLVRAYYQYGLACIRNGKPEKGKQLLDLYNRKRALHETKPYPVPEIGARTP